MDESEMDELAVGPTGFHQAVSARELIEITADSVDHNF